MMFYGSLGRGPIRQVLMDHFEAPSHPGQPRLVNVKHFCEELELVFTKHHLEKTPKEQVPEPGFGPLI